MTFYSLEPQLNNANVSDTEASFLDLQLSISDGFFKIKFFHKRDDFDFDRVNFPFLDGDVPRSTSFGIYTFNLFHLHNVTSSFIEFLRTRILRRQSVPKCHNRKKK